MVDYKEAIKKPFTDIKKLVIGIALSILPIINFFAVGYSLEVARSTLNKKKTLPDWEKWRDLFVNGLLVVIISIVYFLPTLIAFMLSLAYGISAGLASEDILGGLFAAGPFMIIAGLLFLLAAYLLPVSIINFVKQNSFKEAFAINLIFKKAFTVKYLGAWIISAIITLALGFVFGLIPIIGGAIGSFISGIIVMTIYAQVYSEIKK